MADLSHIPDPALVELVARAAYDTDTAQIIGDGQLTWGEQDEQCHGWFRAIATAVLSALAAEGRLLPADAETRTEWGFARWEGDLVWQTTEYAARIAADEHPPAVAMSRPVWVGPWLPAPTDTEERP